MFFGKAFFVAVLEARDVTKTYREGRHEVPVLHGVSLSVARGEVVASWAPRARERRRCCAFWAACSPRPGDGLSSTGRCSTLDRPEQLREIRRRSIGFVFQQFNLFPSLTALGERALRPEPERLARPQGSIRGRAGARRGRPGRPQRLPAPRAFRRPAPAGGGGAGHRRAGFRDPGRRADRQSRLRKRKPRASRCSETWLVPKAGHS